MRRRDGTEVLGRMREADYWQNAVHWPNVAAPLRWLDNQVDTWFDNPTQKICDQFETLKDGEHTKGDVYFDTIPVMSQHPDELVRVVVDQKEIHAGKRLPLKISEQTMISEFAKRVVEFNNLTTTASPAYYYDSKEVISYTRSVWYGMGSWTGNQLAMMPADHLAPGIVPERVSLSFWPQRPLPLQRNRVYVQKTPDSIKLLRIPLVSLLKISYSDRES